MALATEFGTAPHDKVIDGPIISADSHITEPPDTLHRPHRPDVPRPGARTSVHDDEARRPLRHPGHVEADRRWAWWPPRASRPRSSRCSACASRTCTAAAGIPTARLADQERDGVAGEIIYPTVGMVLCNHPDLDYKQACIDAYNLWIAEYCAAAPRPAARRRPDRDAHARGGHRRPASASRRWACAGVMMPGVPGGARTTTRPIYDDVLRGRRRPRAAAVVPHPHRARRTRVARARRSTASCRSSAAARTSWARSCSAACSSATPS